MTDDRQPPVDDERSEWDLDEPASEAVSAGSDATPHAGAGARMDILGAGTPPKRGANKIAIALIAVLLTAIGAAAAIVVVGSTTEAPLADRAAADVVVFGSVTLEPSGNQRDALTALLNRLPEERRDKIGQSLDNALEDALRERGLSWRTDVKPWVGEQLGIVVRSPGAGREPDIVVMIDVEDAAAATRALARATADDPETAFEVIEDVAYVSNSETAISRMRTAAESAPLSENESFKRELERLDGDDALLFLWLNGAKLAEIAQQPGAPSLPALGALAGNTAAVVRAERDGFVLLSHGKLPPGYEPGTGAPALAESTSGGGLGVLTFFDVGGLIEQGLDLARQAPAGDDELSPAQAISFFEEFSGINIANDLVPWLHGEFTVVFGGVSPGPSPLNVGAVIQPTDRAAATRTLDTLRSRLGQLGTQFGVDLQVTPRSGGFDVVVDDVPIAVRQNAQRVVIASSPDYAAELLRTASNKLADDAVYRRVVGEASDRVQAQLFIRVDRIRELVEAALPPDERAEYEREMKPILSLFEALGARVTISGGETDVRLLLTVV